LILKKYIVKNTIKKVVFFGSDIICLPALKWLHTEAPDGCVLVAVISQPDRKKGRGQKFQKNPVAQYALDSGLELLQPETPDQALVDWMIATSIDVAFVMAYGHFLNKKMRKSPKIGMYNFHGSILPAYRGAAPVETAIALGDKETGVSLMKVEQKMDSGAVGAVELVKIANDDSAATLREKVGAAVVPMLAENIQPILEQSLKFEEQEEALVSFCRKLTKEDGMIDFELPAEEIYNRWRAFKTWPGTHCLHDSQRLKIGGLRLLDESPIENERLTPGTVLLSDNRLVVSLKTKAIELLELQRPGGKMLPSDEFLRGYQLKDRDLLMGQKSDSLIK
jgi:methionyl-tRNA formyltransferase